jgi:hypothetical protein
MENCCQIRVFEKPFTKLLVNICTNVQLCFNSIFIILVTSFNFEFQIIYMWSLNIFKVSEILQCLLLIPHYNCDCFHFSSFIYSHHGHVISTNLNILSRPNLIEFFLEALSSKINSCHYYLSKKLFIKVLRSLSTSKKSFWSSKDIKCVESQSSFLYAEKDSCFLHASNLF